MSGWTVLVQHLPAAVLAPVTLGLLYIVSFFMKKTIQGIAKAIEDAQRQLSSIDEKLTTQNENHLSHIQETGIKNTALLEQLVKGQSETSGILRETQGYLKAYVEATSSKKSS